jgi:alkylation response protein AidB-like acyl-CoA dehydrogenase
VTMATILAGTAARLAAKQCQQVMGGMGFTWEHPLHRYVRRALALDALYGSASELTAQVGARLAADGHVPGLVQL